MPQSDGVTPAVKVWIDGQVVEGRDARVSVLDHGFLYGDGVFEGIRVYDRQVFRLADHLDRLATGARAIGLDLPETPEAIGSIVLETARALGQDDCYLRLIVTRGAGALGVDPTTCENPQIVCIASGIELYPPAKLQAGVAMVTVSLRKPAADALDPRVKSLNYLNSVLAKREARLRGADEALILNGWGMVAEAAVANVFAVQRGELCTPPVSDGALAGITRASVLEIARADGIPVREMSMGRFDLLAADEVFLTGTGARIVPVASLDLQPIGAAPESTAPGVGGLRSRPLTERISKIFADTVQSHGTPL
jgi:branched-chain amino acid aminotransferase